MDDDDNDNYQDSDSGTSSTRRRLPSRKTREELNAIEKQRTKRINGQVLSLRNLLEMSNIPTKKDKFSILKNTHDYIIKLRQALHMAEERIAKLNRSRAAGTAGASMDGGFVSQSYEGPDRGGIHYEALFTNSSVAMAITGVDGQFLNCNEAFSQMSGYTKQEIKTVSMFNLTLPEEMNQLFSVVGNMLSYPNQNAKHFWKKCKFREKEETCFVSMWLIRQDDGEPTYFQLMMVPLAECSGAMGVANTGNSGSVGKPLANSSSMTVNASFPTSTWNRPDTSSPLAGQAIIMNSGVPPVLSGGMMGAGGMVGLAGGIHVPSTSGLPGTMNWQKLPLGADMNMLGVVGTKTDGGGLPYRFYGPPSARSDLSFDGAEDMDDKLLEAAKNLVQVNTPECWSPFSPFLEMKSGMAGEDDDGDVGSSAQNLESHQKPRQLTTST